jgi:hypothetical protein
MFPVFTGVINPQVSGTKRFTLAKRMPHENRYKRLHYMSLPEVTTVWFRVSTRTFCVTASARSATVSLVHRAKPAAALHGIGGRAQIEPEAPVVNGSFRKFGAHGWQEPG